jgi:hypothetical protein
LLGTLAMFQQLKPSTGPSDVWAQQRLRVAAAPVLDILEISGYAKLLAELYDKIEIWEPVAKTWDAFLKLEPGALKWLAAVASVGEAQFEMPHRGLLRTQWGIRVQAELEKLPRRDVAQRDSTFHCSYEVVIHPSPLVRYCAKQMFFDGKEIFVSLYLSRQQSSAGLDWGQMNRDLKESLRNEEEDYERDLTDDET